MADRNDATRDATNDTTIAATNGAVRIEQRGRERDRERLAAEVAATSQDFPFLPAFDENGLPILPPEPEEALTAPQRVAIASIISGKTFRSAARDAGVSSRTLYAWRQQPAFARSIDDLSREALETTAVRVRNLMLRATRVLSDSMVGEDAFQGAIRVANSGRLWAALNAGASRLAEREAD